jgi:hypothetical protein
MHYLRRGLVVGSALVFSLVLSGCGSTVQTKPEGQSQNKVDISKSSDVLISGGLFDVNGGRKLVVSATDISAGQIKPKTALVKTGQKIKNLLSGEGFVASADVENLVSNSANIATLPEKTKRIKFINEHQFLYLNDTDEFDHAKSLNLYDTTSKQSIVLYQTQSPWGIDEYVLSPDKEFASLWEVQMSTGSKQLLGGQSKITQVDLKTKQSQTLLGPQQTKNLSGTELSDAQNNLDSSVCVQYPLFYDSQNTLWLDTFCPNAGGLWGAGAYQVSQSSTTLSKNNLLLAGSYSFDPTFSGNGKFVLAVRPPQNGDASSYGVVYAHSNPTVISLISTESTTEQKINTPASIVLSNQPIISDDGTLIAYSAYPNQDDAKNNKNKTLYITNVQTGETKSTPLSGANDPLVFTRQNQAVLLGSPQTSSSGNSVLVSDAGSKYYPNFSSFMLISSKDLTQQESVSTSSGEFIQTRSASGSALAVTVPVSTEANGDNNIKIGAAEFREGLAEQRTSQQNTPSSVASGGPTKEECDAVLPGFSSVTSVPEFFELLKKNGWDTPNDVKVATPGTPERAKWMSPEGIILQHCQHSSKVNPACANSPTKCYDSPLYLYPLVEQLISINSHSDVFNSSPNDKSGNWQVLAEPDGKLILADGKAYSKISYSYKADSEPLGTGIVTSQAMLKPTLSDYADKLGLNQKEKNDFVSFWSTKLKDAPFVQISHYSRAESANILKLDINPQPDTFIPIVMYFKILQFPTVISKPIFEPIQNRVGFTALDWSGVIEK